MFYWDKLWKVIITIIIINSIHNAPVSICWTAPLTHLKQTSLKILVTRITVHIWTIPICSYILHARYPHPLLHFYSSWFSKFTKNLFFLTLDFQTTAGLQKVSKVYLSNPGAVVAKTGLDWLWGLRLIGGELSLLANQCEIIMVMVVPWLLQS